MDLKNTVNLPKTTFPMRAALSEREPVQVRAWLEAKVYEKLIEQNEGGERFILHDGPPYANGSLHLGHFLNKILKDMVVKAQLMSGRLSEYVPGWDCHGLPIELQVDKQLGPKKRQMTASDFRRACRKFAEEQVVLQREGFQRLGVFGRWDKPYLTMSYDYEAQTVRELASIVRKGALYRRKRPVHWCIRDVTALAEAEVEYQEKTSPSIYVGFRVVKGAPEGEPWFLAIWTTTPWTIPANLAVAINPELEYVAYLVPGRGRFVVAKALLHAFLGATFPDELRAPQKGGDDLLSAARATGATLAHPDRVRDVDPEELRTFEYRHPLADRTGIVVFGEHATAETGTGL